MEEIRCLAFLLCDVASRANNGKINLHGIFDRIQVVNDTSRPQPAVGAERPAHLAEKTPLFFVFYKVMVTHPCTLHLAVRDPLGSFVNGSWRDDVSEAGLIQTVWALNVKDFEADGRYTLQLMCGQQIVSETTLDVLHVANGQPKSG
jgi:hypothetical protein